MTPEQREKAARAVLASAAGSGEISVIYALLGMVGDPGDREAIRDILRREIRAGHTLWPRSYMG